jgi:peptidoglycan hydrolase-like protein with peptidoglycan-binding domain
LAVWLAAMLAQPTWAAVQRMGMGPGTYSLGPGGSRAVSAFCLDRTRKSPTGRDSFSEVLTPESRATVTVGGQSMSLQDAIRLKKIAVQGTHYTTEQLMAASGNSAVLDRMSAVERAEFVAMSQEWRAMPQGQRAMLAAQLDPILAEAGDHTRIRLVNLTREPVSVRVEENVAFGGRDDVGSTPAVARIHANRPHDEVQQELWREETRVHQQILADAGHLRGAIDGVPGEQTRAAILAYQRERGLTQNAEIDAPTLRSLKSVSADLRALARVNDANGGAFAVIMIEPIVAGSGRNALYRLTSGPRSLAYASTVTELQTKALQLAGPPSPARIYLVPKELSADRQRGITTSLATRRLAEPDAPDLRLVDFGVSPADHPYFGRRVSRISEEGGGPTEYAAPGTAFRYKQSLQAELERGPPTSLTIYAATRDLVSRSVSNVRSTFAQLVGANRDPTPARLIDAALSRTQRELGLGPAEFRALVRAEVGTQQVADVAAPPDGRAGAELPNG